MLVVMPLALAIGVAHMAMISRAVGRLALAMLARVLAPSVRPLPSCIAELPSANDDDDDAQDNGDDGNIGRKRRRRRDAAPTRVAQRVHRTVIVGGGAAGCAALFHLVLREREEQQQRQRHGHPQSMREIVLIECEALVGGRTRCDRTHTFPIDTGAGFVASFYSLLWNYVRIFGKEDHMIELERRAVLFKRCDKAPDTGTDAEADIDAERAPPSLTGRTALVSLDSLAHVVALPFLSMLDRARFVVEAARMVVLDSFRVSLFDPRLLAAYDTLESSAATLALSRFGSRVYHYVLRPAVESFWYFSCETASGA